jgi:hypothetical protein
VRAANEFQNRLSYRQRPIRPACSQEAAKIELKSTVAQQQKPMEELTAQLQYSIRRRNVKCLDATPFSPNNARLGQEASGQINEHEANKKRSVCNCPYKNEDVHWTASF